MNQFIVVFERVVVELKYLPPHQMIEAGFCKICTASANSHRKILCHREEGGIQLFQADFAPPHPQVKNNLITLGALRVLFHT